MELISVRNKPQQITRLALERPADFAQGRKAWLDSTLTYLIEVSAMYTGLFGQGVPMWDPTHIHKALDFGPQKLYRH